MKYRVVLLKSAENDLREIRDYLIQFGENPYKNFRKDIEKFIDKVSAMPFMFAEYEYDSAYRKAVVIYDYLVFYKVDENNGFVRVYRVLHGKRNMAAYLS